MHLEIRPRVHNVTLATPLAVVIVVNGTRGHWHIVNKQLKGTSGSHSYLYHIHTKKSLSYQQFAVIPTYNHCYPFNLHFQICLRRLLTCTVLVRHNINLNQTQIYKIYRVTIKNKKYGPTIRHRRVVHCNKVKFDSTEHTSHTL